MSKAFIKKLGQCLYEEFRGDLESDQLRDSFTAALNQLFPGKLRDDLSNNIDKNLLKLERQLVKLHKDDVPEESLIVNDSLHELTAEHEMREEHHVAQDKKQHSTMGPTEDETTIFDVKAAIMKRDKSNDEKLKTILEKIRPHLKMESTVGKSMFEWLPSVQLMIRLSGGASIVSITRVLKTAYELCEADMNDTLQKNKPIRCGRLADILKYILTCCHLRVGKQKGKTGDSQAYGHCVGALCSYYVDLCCAHSSKVLEKKAYGRQVCGFVAYLLQDQPEVLLETALQMTRLAPATLSVARPLINKCLENKPATGKNHTYYLKYVLLVRKLRDALDESNQMVSQWLVLTRMLPAGSQFLLWLEEACPAAMEHLPVEDRKFKKARVTRFLLQEASTELIAILYESMTSHDVESDKDVPQTGVNDEDITMETGEITQNDEDLFFLDTGGNKPKPEPTAGLSSGDNQASGIPKLLRSIRELEQILDVENADQTYKIDQTVIEKHVRDPGLKKFFQSSEIVSISSLKSSKDKVVVDDSDDEDEDLEAGIDLTSEETEQAGSQKSGKENDPKQKKSQKKTSMTLGDKKSPKKKAKNVGKGSKDVKPLVKSGLEIVNSETDENDLSTDTSQLDNLQMKSVVSKVTRDKSPQKQVSPKKVPSLNKSATESTKVDSTKTDSDVDEDSLILVENSEDEVNHQFEQARASATDEGDNEVGESVVTDDDRQALESKHYNTMEEDGEDSQDTQRNVKESDAAGSQQGSTLVTSDNKKRKDSLRSPGGVGVDKLPSPPVSVDTDSSVVSVDGEGTRLLRLSPRKKLLTTPSPILSGSSQLESSSILPESSADKDNTLQTETTTSVLISSDEETMEESANDETALYVQPSPGPDVASSVLPTSPTGGVKTPSQLPDSLKKNKSSKSPRAQKSPLSKEVLDVGDKSPGKPSPEKGRKSPQKKKPSDTDKTALDNLDESDLTMQRVTRDSSLKKSPSVVEKSPVVVKSPGNAVGSLKSPKMKSPVSIKSGISLTKSPMQGSPKVVLSIVEEDSPREKTIQKSMINEIVSIEDSDEDVFHKSDKDEVPELQGDNAGTGPEKRTKSTEDIIGIVEQIKDKLNSSTPRSSSRLNKNKGNESMFTDDSVESTGNLSEDGKDKNKSGLDRSTDSESKKDKASRKTIPGSATSKTPSSKSPRTPDDKTKVSDKQDSKSSGSEASRKSITKTPKTPDRKARKTSLKKSSTASPRKSLTSEADLIIESASDSEVDSEVTFKTPTVQQTTKTRGLKTPTQLPSSLKRKKTPLKSPKLQISSPPKEASDTNTKTPSEPSPVKIRKTPRKQKSSDSENTEIGKFNELEKIPSSQKKKLSRPTASAAKDIDEKTDHSGEESDPGIPDMSKFLLGQEGKRSRNSTPKVTKSTIDSADIESMSPTVHLEDCKTKKSPLAKIPDDNEDDEPEYISPPKPRSLRPRKVSETISEPGPTAAKRSRQSVTQKVDGGAQENKSAGKGKESTEDVKEDNNRPSTQQSAARKSVGGRMTAIKEKTTQEASPTTEEILKTPNSKPPRKLSASTTKKTSLGSGVGTRKRRMSGELPANSENSLQSKQKVIAEVHTVKPKRRSIATVPQEQPDRTAVTRRQSLRKK